MQGIRRERSRSPHTVDIVGRRRDNKSQESIKSGDLPNDLINHMMMYQPGNLMMAGGMYPNMLMHGTMISGGIIPPAGMEIMSGTGMELVSQASMDMTTMGAQSVAVSNTPTIDMSMMGGLIMDPSVMGIYPGMSGEIATIPEKKEIVLRHCKLIPPDAGTSEPLRRAKPPGCRTIFVGGLPENICNNTIREIFETYGRIITMRLSNKNYCHIRFDSENSVESAISAISGYRIKLTYRDKDEKTEEEGPHKTSGWLHVDYAVSRDDQNEYKRRLRQVLRAQEAQIEQLNAHQEMANRSIGYRRSPSPVRIQPFSNGAIVQLAEKIKSEEHFVNTLPTLLAWLERGDCSKKNSNQFYSMIQTTNSHIRRLFNEKMQHEEELYECKERVKKSIEHVIVQLEQVAKVFTAATHQRVWDHFTKPQRKNIETWQKMSEEFNSLKEEFNVKLYSNEDIDSNEFNSNKVDTNYEEIQQLKQENESLQFQLEAYKNEVDVIKADARKEMEKFKAQFIARQTLQDTHTVGRQPIIQRKIPFAPPPLPEELNAKVHLKEVVEAGCGEATLIGVMSAFLQVHPKGATLDYVVSYVRALFPHASQATIHHVLQKHDDVFRRTTTGVGANIEHRWSFTAFHSEQTCT